MSVELEIVAVIGALAGSLGVAQQLVGLRKTALEIRKLRRDLEVVQPGPNLSPRQAQLAGSSSPIREKLALFVVLAVLAGGMFYFGASPTPLTGFEVLLVVLSAIAFLLVLTGYTMAKMTSELLGVSTDILSVCGEMMDGVKSVFTAERDPP